MTSGNPELRESITRIQATMKASGLTNARLAAELGVSRQYLWQVVHKRVHISLDRALDIERVLNGLVAASKRTSTFGQRLRAARRSAGFTLKEVAFMIGYSWAGVERWEKDVCRPKPGVLWHLMSIYDASIESLEGATALRPVASPSPSRSSRFADIALGSPEAYQLPLHTRAHALAPTAGFDANETSVGLPSRGRR